MFKRWAGVFGFLFFALLVLVVSVFRSAEARYVFTQTPSPSPDSTQPIEIDYLMPYPGSITPDSFLWPVKALRDKIWLGLTFDPAKRAAILLSNADKRIQMAQKLFEEGKPDLAASTMTKAEKYLEEAIAEEKKARAGKIANYEFMQSLALSTLKHRQLLEGMLKTAPEDAKPAIVKMLDYPKKLFEEAKNMLVDAGQSAPKNPYEGQ